MFRLELLLKDRFAVVEIGAELHQRVRGLAGVPVDGRRVVGQPHHLGPARDERLLSVARRPRGKGDVAAGHRFFTRVRGRHLVVVARAGFQAADHHLVVQAQIGASRLLSVGTVRAEVHVAVGRPAGLPANGDPVVAAVGHDRSLEDSQGENGGQRAALPIFAEHRAVAAQVGDAHPEVVFLVLLQIAEHHRVHPPMLLGVCAAAVFMVPAVLHNPGARLVGLPAHHQAVEEAPDGEGPQHDLGEAVVGNTARDEFEIFADDRVSRPVGRGHLGVVQGTRLQVGQPHQVDEPPSLFDLGRSIVGARAVVDLRGGRLVGDPLDRHAMVGAADGHRA